MVVVTCPHGCHAAEWIVTRSEALTVAATLHAGGFIASEKMADAITYLENRNVGLAGRRLAAPAALPLDVPS